MFTPPQDIQLNVVFFLRMPPPPPLASVSPGHFTSPPALQPGGGNAQLDILQIGTDTFSHPRSPGIVLKLIQQEKGFHLVLFSKNKGENYISPVVSLALMAYLLLRYFINLMLQKRGNNAKKTVSEMYSFNLVKLNKMLGTSCHRESQIRGGPRGENDGRGRGRGSPQHRAIILLQN